MILNPDVNTFSIENVSSADVTSLPYTFQRVFADGEIHDTPIIVGLASQWTVLARYASGYVRRAVCQTVFPLLVMGVPVAFFFANTTVTNVPGPRAPISATLNASIALTRGGKTVTADAKTMFDAGYAKVIYDGPIATTFIIRDTSPARIYDIGFDSYRSARPAFLATYWYDLGWWQIGAELSNVVGGILGDVACDKIVVIIGGKTVRSKAPFVSYWGTWIREDGWISGAPDEQINFDHNLGWLANQAKVLGEPYDPAFQALWTEPVIAKKFNTWENNPNKGFNEPGFVEPHMNQTEASTDPSWCLDVLFSGGDWRMRKVMLGQTYLAGCWRTNFIENDPSLWFDAAKTVKAFGKPPSIFARPVERISDPPATNSPFLPHDEGVPRAPYALSWQAAHQPNMLAIPYLLTGDPLLLEALQRWAMFDQMSVPVNPTPAQQPLTAYVLRASGIGGYGTTSTRGAAWALNILLCAKELSTDGTPEKDYLKVLCDARFAVDFGLRGGSVYGSTPAYKYGVIARNSVKQGTAKFSPLGYWQMANVEPGDEHYKHGATWGCRPWQNDYRLLVDGRALDYGETVQEEIDAISQPTRQFFAEFQTDPIAVNPKWFRTYTEAWAVASTLPMFSTHAEAFAELIDTDKAVLAMQFDAGASHYVPLKAATAAVFCKKSDPLWQWIMANVRNDNRWDHIYINEPYLCVSPRDDTPPPPPPKDTLMTLATDLQDQIDALNTTIAQAVTLMNDQAAKLLAFANSVVLTPADQSVLQGLVTKINADNTALLAAMGRITNPPG